jgi:GTP-binding protein
VKFHKAHFITTVCSANDLPSSTVMTWPEIGILGRSNVGKSSLLNHLFGSKNLVKTSSTPGKTRALNFFLVDDRLCCVDMPGYGYSKVSLQEKKQWAYLIEHYLNTRSNLKMLLFLFDIRRLPTEEDEQMLSWIRYRGLPTLLILTKVDKVGQSERTLQTRRITSRLKEIPHVHYSVTQNVGRKVLIAKICEFLSYGTT